MASFTNLSRYLVAKIVFLLVCYKAEDLKAWKQKLPVIGVCRQWRDLAIRHVYNHVFFEDYCVHIDNNKQLRRRIGQYYFQQGRKKPKPVLVTNLDLYIMLERCDYVRYFDINLNVQGPNYLFFEKLFKLLDQTKGKWKNVQRLILYIYFLDDEAVYSYIFFNFKNRDYYMDRLAKYAKDNFSKSLSIYSNCLRDTSDIFIENMGITSLYLLKDIRIPMASLCSFQYLPQDLVSLNLCFNKIDKALRLPVIFAESLQNLLLDNLPPGFDWSCFHNPFLPYFANVTFANLKKLHVYYRPNNDDSGMLSCDLPECIDIFGVKFIFPKLDDLEIRDCSRNNSLLYAEFPNKALKVEYGGSVSSIALCRKITIKSKELSLSITCAFKHEEGLFYKITNEIFADNEKHEDLGMMIEGIHFLLNADLVKWNCLRSLILHCPFNFKTLIQLFSKLPCLFFLCIDFDCIKNIVGIRFEMSSDLPPGCLPTISSVNALMMHHQFDPYKYPAILYVVKTLISRITCLQLVLLNSIFKDDIDLFIKRHSSDFPNLNEINIRYVAFPEFSFVEHFSFL